MPQVCILNFFSMSLFQENKTTHKIFEIDIVGPTIGQQKAISSFGRLNLRHRGSQYIRWRGWRRHIFRRVCWDDQRRLWIGHRGGSRGGTPFGSGGSGGEVGATSDGEGSISGSLGLSDHLLLQGLVVRSCSLEEKGWWMEVRLGGGSCMVRLWPWKLRRDRSIF